MIKTINRGWLKKQINAGKMLVKSTIQLTDDYRFDMSTNFGKSDEWVNAKEYNFTDWDFKTKSGYASEENGEITFSIHSNSYYKLKKI